MADVNEYDNDETLVGKCNAENINQANFLITSEAITKLLQNTRTQLDIKEHSGFPRFDPDHSRINIRNWCADIDTRVERDGLANFDILPRIQNALSGRAKIWYDKFGYQHYQWADLRSSIIHAFDSGTDIVTQLRTVANCESENFSSYTQFVMQKVSQINRLPFTIPEDKIIKIVIGCISEENLRNSLTFIMPTTVQNLIDHLASVREKPKRKNDIVTHRLFNDDRTQYKTTNLESERNDIPSKRFKPGDNKRCYGCGRVGHIRNKCPENNESKNLLPKHMPFYKNPVENKEIKCGFCEKTGHEESTCWAKRRTEQKDLTRSSVP